MTYRGKRALDLVISTIGVGLCFPFIFPAFCTILLLYKKNPFFIQERIGLNEKPFKLIKIRTMFSSDHSFLRKMGLLLRKFSLDELPQFINVLRGDMSLVGPRPLLTEYLPLYNEQQRKRHAVRPGMTGLAQISGRNKLPWEKRFALDVWYVQHLSFQLDLKIIILTCLVFFNPKDVKPEGLSEEDKFKGNGKYRVPDTSF